jgi:hypothetical protein
MKRAFPALGLLLACAACSKEKAAQPADIIAQAAGRYSGRLHYSETYFDTTASPPGPQQLRWSRDTTLTITATSPTTLGVLNRTGLSFEPGTSSSEWRGHQPQRQSYSFGNGAPPSNAALVQVERTSDSVFVASREGAILYGKSYVFYGKRLP